MFPSTFIDRSTSPQVEEHSDENICTDGPSELFMALSVPLDQTDPFVLFQMLTNAKIVPDGTRFSQSPDRFWLSLKAACKENILKLC